MAIIEVNSQDHEREFDLSYSSDEPTIGGGKGGTTEPLICNGTYDIELSELTLDKTAGEVYSALRAGRSVIVTQTVSGSTVESMPIIGVNTDYTDDVETGESIPRYSFYVFVDVDQKFVGENFRADDTLVLALVVSSNP